MAESVRMVVVLCLIPFGMIAAMALVPQFAWLPLALLVLLQLARMEGGRNVDKAIAQLEFFANTPPKKWMK